MNTIFRTAIHSVTRLCSSVAAMVCCALPALLTVACSDELDNPAAGDWQEGVPAEITLSVGLSDRQSFSRGDLAPGLDKTVNSLWIGIYNVKSGARTASQYFTVGDKIDSHDLRDITIKTLSGPSRIVAVANYDYRYASVDSSGDLIPLKDAIEQADTWDKYTGIAIAFNREGAFDVETPINPLIMSGYYTTANHSSGDRPEMTELNISPGMSTPSGAIHLRRLISQVKFNVTYDTENIESFTVNSYRIVNVPRQSWLHERADGELPLNSSDDRTAAGKTYGSTNSLIDLTRKDNTVSFDFWALENKRTGRPGVISSWAEREREYKDAATGFNTDKFISLVDGADSNDPNNNATYVAIYATMEMKVDENGKPLSEHDIAQRTVEVEYAIHLGFVDNDLYDFNHLRNSVYTYNVNVSNVNDMVVEAKKEGEPNPATSGFVSDITDRFVQLDAHYCAFSIRLTEEDIKDFEYVVHAPTMDGRTLLIDSHHANTVPARNSADFIYLNWIELRYNTNQGEDRLADYKPHKDETPTAYNDTYYLTEIKGNKNLRAGWYTVFINEYTYEPDAPDGNESRSTNWRNYVNKPDRRVWLNVAAETSADMGTIHYKSKYALSQQSIQTFYNSEATSGFGVEHTNESLGLNLRNNYNWTGKYDSYPHWESGRRNLWGYMEFIKENYSWSTYIETTQIQDVHAINNLDVVKPARTEPLPRIKTNPNANDKNKNTDNDENINIKLYDPDRTANPYYVEMIIACLNRNRDLDGDGVIDKNEVRWYVPTKAQVINLVIGKNSLRNPLNDFTGIQQLPDKTNNGRNPHLLMATGDGFNVWLMEGMATSKWRQYTMAAPWEVRCVRQFGTDMTVIKDDIELQDPAPKRNGRNIIDLLYYDPLSVREEAFYSSAHPMPVHRTADRDYNRCYRSFEYAEDVIGLDDPRLGIKGTSIEWASYLASHNPCDYLVKETGRDGWRVPNQVELALIVNAGDYDLGDIPSDNKYQASCTFDYFTQQGANPGPNPVITSDLFYLMKIVSEDGRITRESPINGEITNATYGIRCVRDTDD